MKNKRFPKWLVIFFVLLGFIVVGLGAFSLLPTKVPAEALEQRAEKIVIDKSSRLLTVWSNGAEVAQYQISLGDNPQGHKQQEGDSKTPEGKYKISYKNPRSLYHLSLRISYPNRQDKFVARQKGVNPGGDIMIHGYPKILPNFAGNLILKGRDWTQGCIAVSNDEIEHLWQIVKVGTEVEILP